MQGGRTAEAMTLHLLHICCILIYRLHIQAKDVKVRLEV